MAGTYTYLLYHLVFSTKGRFPLVSRELQPELYAYVGGIVRGEGGVLIEIGGMPDHVHLLAKFKPTASLSEILRLVKGSSSKWVNVEKFNPQVWLAGRVPAFSVSESQVDAVREYIRTQEAHHRRLSYQDEFRSLLDRHGIEYEERIYGIDQTR